MKLLVLTSIFISVDVLTVSAATLGAGRGDFIVPDLELPWNMALRELFHGSSKHTVV